MSDAELVFRGFRATFNVTICPANCTGDNGRCNVITKTCMCNFGWHGEKCAKRTIFCGENGQLDSILNKCR